MTAEDRVRQERLGRLRASNHTLENRCPKGLVGSSPTPSAQKWLLTWSFAIWSCHCFPDKQLSGKPLSQVLGLPDSSCRIGVRREIGPKTARGGESVNLLATRGAGRMVHPTKERAGLRIRRFPCARTTR
jgi:hypothetical protein